MKLKIERTVGECWESYDMEGDYEEVLALVTELGFCKDVVFNPNVIINTNIQQPMLDKFKEMFLSEWFKIGSMTRKQYEEFKKSWLSTHREVI